MAEDKIDSIIDIVSIKKELEVVADLTKKLGESLKNIPKAKIQIDGAQSAKEFSVANAKLIQETKAVINLVNQRFAADAKVIALQTDYAKATAASRVESQKQNAELKTQAQLQAANTGSLEKARASVKALRAEQEGLNLITAEGQARNAAIIKDVDRYNQFIKKNSDALAQQKINVGNYSGAINVLQKSLTDVTAAINKNTASGKGNSDATKKLQQEERILNELLKAQATGFSKGALEVRANEKALLDLSRAGLQNTDTFRKLAKATGELKDGLSDIKARTKALGSDTFAFDAAIQGAQTLAGIYGVAQGAAALFGKENEDLAKVLVKLQAVQAVITGLQQVQNAVQKESVLILGLQSLREKALLAVQTLRNFVLRGTTAATVANTVSTTAQTGAMVGTTVATRVATGALIGLRGALIATGIGAILILLTSAASAMGSFGDSTKLTTEEIEAQNAALEKNRESLSKIAEESEKARNRAAGGINELKRDLEIQTAKGASEEKLFKLKQEIQAKELFNIRVLGETFKKDIDKRLEISEEFKDKKNKILADEIAFKKNNEDKDREKQSKASDEFNKKQKAANDKAAAEALRRVEADKRATFDIFKDSAQERADLAKNDSGNEDLPLKERLNRLIDFNNEAQSILIAQKNFDLENTKLTELERQAIVNKFGIASNAQLADFLAGQAAIKKTAKQKELDEFTKGMEDQRNMLDADNNLLKKGSSESRNKELLQAAIDFKDGKIKTTEDLRKAELEINERYDDLDFAREIKVQKAKLLVATKPEDIQAALDAIDALEEARANKKIDKIKGDAEKEIAIRKEVKDAIKQLEKEAFDTFVSLIDAGFEKQVQDLDNRKRLLDEESARKINNINLLGLNEVERTRQIAIVQKDAAFQSEQIERRKREIAVQRARFEKAQSIASIIQNTATAVVAALPNIPLSIIIGTIGALQLAKAIATPIPKYKGGRGYGKKELAEVGDGYVNEYILRESGAIEKTPAVPTLTQLMPKDVVFKDQNSMLMAMINASNPFSKVLNNAKINTGQSNGLDKEILSELKEIRKRTGISIHNNIPIESTAYYQFHIKN